MAKPWYAAQKGYDSVGTHRLAALTHDIRYENDGMTKEAERWRLVFIHDGQKHAVTAGDGGELGRKVQAQLTKFDIPSNSEVSQDIVQCLLHTMGHPLAPKKPSPAHNFFLACCAMSCRTASSDPDRLSSWAMSHPSFQGREKPGV